MSFPIPTAEAKARKLSGSDVFRRSAFLYLDDHHRAWGAVGLNLEAIRAFSDTIEIKERAALAEHRAAVADWIAKGALAAGLDYPWQDTASTRMEFLNFEHLKLASGFELHLKARLVALGFVVHCLDARDPVYSKLAAEQRKRPVHHDEVIALQGHLFDGKQNYLPGLTAKSLKFSFLTQEAGYRTASGLDGNALDIIDDYRTLRNNIHLPGDVSVTPAIVAFARPMIEFLLPFINTEIVDRSNALIEQHGLLYPKLARLS